MANDTTNPICRRIAQVRLATAGPRGKAAFARQLDISPSTYDYYEDARIPPADLLVKIAEVADVDLRWLLTGEESSPAVPAGPYRAILQRAAAVMTDSPQAADALEAFLDILQQTARLNEHAGGSTAADPHGGDTAAHPTPPPRSADTLPTAPSPAKGWIPILGRSAAGVVAMWDPADPTDALTTLGELIATHAPGPDDLPSRTARTVSEQPDHHQPTVRIITLREPPTELAGRVAGQSSGPVEFLDAPHIKADHPDAVAVRIDGESMSPEIRHGDLVVLSPSAPAEAGRAAVVQLSGAIGVTCKLYHPAGPRVHLVPINDQFPPTTVEAQTVEWALKVLACIRP